MLIKSPLASLVDAIRQVAASAQRYDATLRRNEAATRAVLIDPVLRALGWDIGNTSMVEVEKTLDDTRVDYALYDGNGEVKIIVEAKSLGKNLGDGQSATKLLAYAFKHGAADVFLTDGLTWRHYANFQPGNVAPVKSISLAEDRPVDSAAYLVQSLDAARFWPEEQDIDTIATQLAQLESTVTSLRAELDQLNLEARPIAEGGGPSYTPRPSEVSAIETPTDLDLVPLESATSLTGKRPKLLLLPTGVRVSVRKWKDVLVESCKATMAMNPTLPIPLLDAAGRKVALLDKDPPPKGLSHVSVTYREKLVYIYTNYDANHCVLNSVHILSYFPKERSVANPSVAFE